MTTRWCLRAAALLCVLSICLAAGAARSLAASPAAARGATPGATRVGRPATGRTVALVLPLAVRSAALARAAAAVSTPGSTRYGDDETIAMAARRFGASRAVRRSAVAYLRAHGATHVSIDVTGLFAKATMRIGTAQRLFGTDLATYRSDAERGDFVAPTSVATVPAALRGAVTGVVGLDTQPLETTPLEHLSPSALTGHRAHGTRTPARSAASDSADAGQGSAYPARTGTPSGCAAATAQKGFTPNQYLTAYGYDPLHELGVAGEGERVALIEIDGFKPSDIQTFAKCFGVPVPRINTYGVGIKNALNPGGEATLDLELLDAAAPGLKDIDVYESQPTAADVLTALTEPLAAKGRTPDVISASLGACENSTTSAIGASGVKLINQAMELAAVSGISVVASSGDDGSTACVDPSGNPLDVLAVNYPASSPWITSVGGTNVTLDAANGIDDAATDQVTWNDEPAAVGAGGGGTSTFPRPAYQSSVVHGNRREVPDVAMLADPLPGYEIYCTVVSDCRNSTSDNPWVTFGGTSAGTPLLAGGFALIDQALRARGQTNLGFANPLLYKIAGLANASATIADVVKGSNDISGNVFGTALGCCNAAPGYDEATGLGSVNLGSLATEAEALEPKRVQVALTVAQTRQPASAGHLSAHVACTSECLMGAYAVVRIGRAPSATLYSAAYELTVRRSRTVTIKLPAKERVRLQKAIAQHRSVTASIRGALLEPSGTIESRTAPRTVHLTR